MSATHLFENDSSRNIRKEPCPKCGGEVRMKFSGNHSFWGCSQYPSCNYTQSLHETGDFEPQPLSGEHCPNCGSELQIKKGRYGLFIGCSGFPACHFMLDPTSEEGAQNIPCPQCGKGHIQQRTNKFGKAFYACDGYPKCKYVLNDPPVAEACPECGWAVLVKRSYADGERLRCPQKACTYKSKPL